MAPLTPLPDKVEVQHRIDTTLAWNPHLPRRELPAEKPALEAIEMFLDYGPVLINELHRTVPGLPDGSPALAQARTALGEARRRLHPPEPHASHRAVILRAQCLARLTRALLHATGRAAEEHTRDGPF